MKYTIELNDKVEMDTLSEISDENNMTPNEYILSMLMTFLNKRMRGKVMENVKKMTPKDIRNQLKEKK